MATTTTFNNSSTYTPIYSTTLSSAAASITLSSIPTTYTDLILVCKGGTAASGQSIYVQLNSDSSSIYSDTVLAGSGSAATSTRATSLSGVRILGRYHGTSGTLNDISITHFQDYSNSTTFKPIINRSNQTAGVTASMSLWRSTAPITSMTFIGEGPSNILSGTTFTLYGIKAATPAPKATGGQITTDGTYWYHAFNFAGLFETKQALTCDYLVVGGGGGGAVWGGGGGGAGGYRTSVGTSGGGAAAGSTLSLTAATTYPVTVGAGGSSGMYDGYSTAGRGNGYSGSNSTFATVTALGGGYGGAYGGGNGFVGGNGGSGGGGGAYNTAGGSASSPTQGYGGGTSGGGSSPYKAGAGGGAGAAGSNFTGGAGSNSASALAYATGTGVSGYFAGGGGGGGNPAGGSGGSGGGGAGSFNTNATAGTANTGSGGGGTWNTETQGGNGGSGLVIVRYAV